jgi:uncharacterized membrane protein YoaK (UPF0700 family)
MLFRLGDARDAGTDRRLAWSLAGIAGALNTAGFYAVGLYSSNMTGNVSALADHAALADVAVVATYMALVAIFVTGAATSALLINAGSRQKIPSIYAFSILLEAALLSCLACADLWMEGLGRGTLLAYGLSFLMGLQNATVTRISNARVRTTHVTGMVTDIGIEIGNLIDLIWLRRGRQEAEIHYNRERLGLHGITVLSFLTGGMLGVVAYKHMGPYFLFAVAAILLALALPGIVARTVVAAR